ncbi:integrating conjugative element protein [Klebsiella variicola]|uniref:integrating conjugative element protein n=1 Tax=Klebsiella variicola TaxID=244366 RepID=UPI0024424C79|nr:integrating conjugative element protein [Klebsiella variicola]
MMNPTQSPHLLSLAVASALFVTPTAPAAENWAFSEKGLVSDALHYRIGGGNITSGASNSGALDALSPSVKWKTNLMCGNFDLSTTVSNQLNGLTDGFQSLMGDVLNSASGAVSSLPGLIMQRSNPGLYELITNGSLQASAWFDQALLTCQGMTDKVASQMDKGGWFQAARAQNYIDTVASTSDAIQAGRSLDKDDGSKGVRWVGGNTRGGKGQEAIRPTRDLSRAGYNILNSRDTTSTATVTDSQCQGTICGRWSSSTDASEDIVSILGDRAIRTCADPDACSDGGTTEQDGYTTPGTGLSPVLDATAQHNLEVLTKLVSGGLDPTDSNLATLKTGGMTISRNVITALRRDTSGPSLVRRLADDLAMSDTISLGLDIRRVLTAGIHSEPDLSQSTAIEAAHEAGNATLERLDSELQALKLEMDMRRAVATNALLTVLERNEGRSDNNPNVQINDDVDAGLTDMQSTTAEE